MERKVNASLPPLPAGETKELAPGRTRCALMTIAALLLKAQSVEIDVRPQITIFERTDTDME